MILVGTMDWPKTLEIGDFFCPECDRSQKFRRRASRPFLTVYFIPVVPIGGLQEYVECQTCKTNFEPIILGDPTPEAERSYERDMIKVAALTIIEDDRVTETEIRMALAALRLLGQIEVSRDELGEACSEMRSRQLRLNGFLWTARQRMIPEERARVIELIFLISSAEGKISPRRLQSLVQCHAVLELTPDQFQQCIATAEQLIEDTGRSR